MSSTEQLDDEQLEEKKKILVLGDKAAFEQQAALTVEKNKEIIDHFKQENADLRKRVIQIKRENLSVHSNDSEGRKRQLQDDLIRIRKELDTQVTLKQQRTKQKKKLQEQYNELAGLRSGKESESKKKIRSLENQLDKVIIKFNEAQSIKKTYEQIVKRLNAEQSDFNSQLEQMEETMRQKNEDYEELLLMQKSARAAREMAKEEVKRLRNEMNKEKEGYEKKLEEKRVVLERKVQMREKKEEEEREKRMQNQMGNEEDSQMDTASMTADGMYEKKKYAMGSTSPTDNQIQKIQEQLEKDEESFRKIKEATGDDDINKVIQKFLVQAEYLKECDERRKATEERLERAKKGQEEARDLVEAAKEAGGEKVSNKLIFEQSKKRVAHLKSQEEESRKRYIEAKQLQIEVKEGMKLLCQKLSVCCFDAAAAGLRSDDEVPHLPDSDAPNPELMESNPEELFSKLEACLEFLVKEEEEKERKDKEEAEEKEKRKQKLLEEGMTLEELEEKERQEAVEKEGEEQAEEKNEEAQVVPEWNTRIKFDEDENNEDESDSDENEEDNYQGHALEEKVLDREALKRAALEAVELAAQRAKKAKKDDDY